MAEGQQDTSEEALRELRARAGSRSRSQAVWRARIVLAHLEGQSYRRVSERFGCSQATVAKWLARFREGGVGGLDDKPRETRPGPRQEMLASWLPKILRRKPRSYGLQGTRWTLHLLQQACESETGERPSLETIRRSLRELESSQQG